MKHLKPERTDPQGRAILPTGQVTQTSEVFYQPTLV